MSSPVGSNLTRAANPRGPNLREPGPPVAEPGRRTREPGAIPIRQAIDDRWLMATLIPAFGLVIPHATGLGHLWFVGGAATIYLANRTLVFAGRAGCSRCCS